MSNYPPELRKDFQEFLISKGVSETHAAIWELCAGKVSKLDAFAHNWHRVRELEEALRAFVDNSSIQANHPHECEQAEELLEKGNE